MIIYICKLSIYLKCKISAIATKNFTADLA